MRSRPATSPTRVAYRRSAPTGSIHFEWHDGQVQSRHHLLVVEEAAKRHIAIDAHEPIKDTGLRRTYPNWVAREGARGMEYNAWGDPVNPPEHEANLVFTRMLGGPMDFTPGVLSLTRRGRSAHPVDHRQATRACTSCSTAPSRWPRICRRTTRSFPGPFQFIKDVPVDWADTRVLNGEVGDYVTMARKDRGSDDWYLGAITDEQPRTLQVPLGFLDAGRRTIATIYRDGKGAGSRVIRRRSRSRRATVRRSRHADDAARAGRRAGRCVSRRNARRSQSMSTRGTDHGRSARR